jgi:L-ascorbate 6-phosphate lactonase
MNAMRLIERINNTKVEKGSLAIFYLAQAGFCIKTSEGKIIVIDAYLSDCCERLFSFKRMIPHLIEPDELRPDLYISTHEHADHLDPDAIAVIKNLPGTFFIGSPGCQTYYKELGIHSDRYCILCEGDQWESASLSVRGVYADHGDLAPEALGFLLTIDGIRIYHTGDTSYRPGEIIASLNSEVDILMVPINGVYENMNAAEAVSLANDIQPKVVIATHFWMFLEHVAAGGKGDPATFISESKRLPISIRPMVMSAGEMLIYKN